MNSSKREETPWTKSRKKPGPKNKEKGDLFDKSRRKELAAKVKKVPLDVWFFGGRHDFPSLSLSSVFSICVCPEAFLVDITSLITDPKNGPRQLNATICHRLKSITLLTIYISCFVSVK